MTADLTTNYDAETNTLLAEKIKNAREHNFEGGTNNSKFDKDTDSSNLDSKVKYLRLALPLNIQFLLLIFSGFNTCKVRFGISYISTIIIVTSGRECWFALRMELHVLSRRHDEYSWWLWSTRKKFSIWLMYMTIMMLVSKKYNNSDLVGCTKWIPVK